MSLIGRSKINAIGYLKREAQLTLKSRGVIGTLRAAVVFLFVRFKHLAFSRRRTFKLKREAELAFDSKYGVDTSGSIKLSSLNIENENWIYGGRYQPIDCVAFSQLLAELVELEIACEEFIFIDLGSGKGRAVLLASALPFKKIIGIEFSEELTSIAKNNLCLYPKEEMKCKDIELNCIDAIGYHLPEEPLVLYLYNPFRGAVMSQVIDNVTASFKKKPRRIVILYFNPVDAHLWDNVGFLTKVRATPELIIFDARVPEIDIINGS